MTVQKPVCIIPARSGSVRIKNKNIYKIDGIPMIGHVIKMLIKSKIFSQIVVSTDSPKIASIAKNFGAKVPFIRSKKLSGSNATIKDTVVDAIKKIKSQAVPFHFVIYPTAILVESIDLHNAYKLLKKNTKANMVLPVVENTCFYRSLLINKKNKKEIIWKWKKFSNTMSQNLDKVYNDSGTFFIFKTKSFLSNKNILQKFTIPFKINKKKGIDVNNNDDLDQLRYTYSLLKNKNFF